MRRLEVNMHICPFHIGQALELRLEFLGDVVRGAQGLVGVHDDVDFDDDARAAVVGADGVDAGDHGGVGHCCGEGEVSIYGMQAVWRVDRDNK